MLAWYIGSARGPGNPYGVAAATVRLATSTTPSAEMRQMVLLAPFLFMRIIAPLQQMPFWMMTGVTILFVVGYSWVDEHVYEVSTNCNSDR